MVVHFNLYSYISTSTCQQAALYTYILPIMLSRFACRSFSTSAARAVKVSTIPSTSSTVSSLKVIVKGAGSKSTPAGLSHLLASSAFLDTASKSGLRIKRESELLGGSYKAEVTRDALVLKATFLKEALPFYVNTFAKVLSETTFKPHELAELALPFAEHETAVAYTCPRYKAVEALHAISFKRGLGLPLLYDGTKTYTSTDLSNFAKTLFTSDKVEVVGQNVDEAALNKFVSESSIAKLPAPKNPTVSKAVQKTYTGVESRIRQAGKTCAVIGVPIAPKDIDSYELVSAAVYNAIPKDYDVTVMTDVIPYEDAGLYWVSIASLNPAVVAEDLKKAAAAYKKASGSSLAQYKPLAQYLAAAKGHNIELSGAKTISLPKFNLSVVGDVDSIPVIDEL